MFFNPSLTFCFKMFISTKAGIVAWTVLSLFCYIYCKRSMNCFTDMYRFISNNNANISKMLDQKYICTQNVRTTIVRCLYQCICLTHKLRPQYKDLILASSFPIRNCMFDWTFNIHSLANIRKIVTNINVQ